METKEMICILCPLGCKMQVRPKPGKTSELSVRGQKCGLGIDYAYDEYTNPTRTVTSTVVIHNAPLPRLPVKTEKPVPRDLVFAVLDEIAAVELTGPVKIGTVIKKELLGTDANLVATRSL
ncbi:MAG: DUF1667 domain-containing protein [Bacillota bacterium]